MTKNRINQLQLQWEKKRKGNNQSVQRSSNQSIATAREAIKRNIDQLHKSSY